MLQHDNLLITKRSIMFSKLKQFKDMRNQAKKLQDLLGQESVEGSGGWGKVKIKMSGNQEVQAVTIDPEILKEPTRLQEMIKEAINDAIKKAQRVMAEKVKSSGFKLPEV